jgi:hypothetical protein
MSVLCGARSAHLAGECSIIVCPENMRRKGPARWWAVGGGAPGPGSSHMGPSSEPPTFSFLPWARAPERRAWASEMLLFLCYG